MTEATEERERTSQSNGWVVAEEGRKLEGLECNWPIGAMRSLCERQAFRRDVPMWPVAPKIYSVCQ